MGIRVWERMPRPYSFANMVAPNNACNFIRSEQGRIQEIRKGGGGGGGGHRKGVGAGGGCVPSRAKRGSFKQYSNTDTHS